MFSSPQPRQLSSASSTTTCTSTTKRSAPSRPGRKTGWHVPVGIMSTGTHASWTQSSPSQELICPFCLSLISALNIHWLIHPAISATYLPPSSPPPLSYCHITGSACSSSVAAIMFIKHGEAEIEQSVFPLLTSELLKTKKNISTQLPVYSNWVGDLVVCLSLSFTIILCRKVKDRQ